VIRSLNGTFSNLVVLLSLLAEENESKSSASTQNMNEDLKNRLAAAEFDISVVAKHLHDGSHPNLMET
jgi:hypothetical protein